MDNLTPPTPPPAEVVTDLEFIFLGGTKLIHSLREQDSFEDRGDHYYICWDDTGEDALLFKSQLLQFGRRVRFVMKADQSAVAKRVAEIKAQEAVGQGVVGPSRGRGSVGVPPVPAASPLGSETASPGDLWARSPLKR